MRYISIIQSHDISDSITELTDAIGSALTFLLIIGVIGYLLLKRRVEKEEKKQKTPPTVDKLFELRKKLVDDLNNSIKNIVDKNLTDDELFELRKKLVHDKNNAIKNIVDKNLTDDESLKREEELVELESKFRYLEHLNWLGNKNGESEIDKLIRNLIKQMKKSTNLEAFMNRMDWEMNGLMKLWKKQDLMKKYLK